MKKIIKISIIFTFILSLTGCINKDDMEDITIYATSYPIEYVANRLYGEKSTVKSIYPNGVDINEYEITNTLLNTYDDVDLYIFNGLSSEKNYIEPLLKVNKDLKIIDSTSSLQYNNTVDELWLDPAKLLTIANNIKQGFNEYTEKKYLINQIEENYNSLKIDLTNLDAKYRSAAKKADYKTIVVSSDVFLYLEKYDLEVISLDEKSVTQKNITTAKELINSGKIKYIYIKNGENVNDTINEVISGTNVKTIELNTLANLTDDEKSKYDYLSISNQNLESLKEELYK